jgi:hypothetical protein
LGAAGCLLAQGGAVADSAKLEPAWPSAKATDFIANRQIELASSDLLCRRLSSMGIQDRKFAAQMIPP